MRSKIIVALSALLLCVSTSIRASPLLETRDLAEPLEERSFDETLVPRDMLEDPLEELAIRGKAAGGSASKSFAAAKKKIPAAKETKKKPSTQPAAKAKNTNALAEQQRARAAKAAKQPPVVPGSRKEAKIAERKENRELAKKQKWAAGAAAGRYKLGANGKPIDKNTPTTQEAKDKRTAKKALAKASYDKLSEKKKQDRAQQQKKEQKKNAPTVAANRERKRQQTIATKAAARTAGKAARRAEMAQARGAYQASINTGTFPNRGANFNTPQGRHYSGRDVRQALFTGHHAAQRGGVGYNAATGEQTQNRHPKQFQNRPNAAGGLPLPGMAGRGREFGMLSGKRKGYDGRTPNPSEARLITQQNAAGVQEFRGVVAHPANSNDHVQVPQTK